MAINARNPVTLARKLTSGYGFSCEPCVLCKVKQSPIFFGTQHNHLPPRGYPLFKLSTQLPGRSLRPLPRSRNDAPRTGNRPCPVIARRSKTDEARVPALSGISCNLFHMMSVEFPQKTGTRAATSTKVRNEKP